MKYSVITIGREHGSGGRLLAQKIADALNIPLYDKKLIHLIASESGFSEKYVEQAETKHTSSFLYNLYFDSTNLPIDDQLFIAQSNVIKKAAAQSPCVIVGRCANYVLRKRTDCLNLFVYAPMEERIHRITEEYHEQVQNKDVQRYLEKYDKQRAAYYERFTGEHWGDPHQYHLMVNSTVGLNPIAEHITKLVKESDTNA